MALDMTHDPERSGSECWRCGGLGWWEQQLSEAELRPYLPKGAEFIRGHATVRCQECNPDRRL